MKGGEIMNTMAQRLKWLRKEKCHKTQEEVAKHVGVQKAAIQKYENGIVANIPSDKIELLAEALETTPGFIMGWEDDPEYNILDKRFGGLLRQERERQGKSIRDFAKQIGISERMLAKYERGEIIPTYQSALPIAILLNIPMEEYDPVYTQLSEQKKSKRLSKEIIQLLPNLSEKKQQQILDYIRFLATQESNE